MMKRLLIMLLLFSFAFPQGVIEEVEAWQVMFQTLLVSVAMLAVLVAAVAYVMAGMFGAETRASIQVWAQSLLAAAGLSLVILILLNIILPLFTRGGEIDYILTRELLPMLLEIARQSLFMLTMLLVVIAAAVYAIGQMFGADTRARASNWAQILITSAVVAAAIYVLVFEIIIRVGEEIPLPAGLDTYRGIIIYTIIFVGLIVLITYMASKILRVPEWEAYLTIEMTDLLTSLLIVLLVVGMFTAATSVANSINAASGYTDAATPPAAAIKVISKIIGNVEEARTDAFKIQACASILSTFHKRTGESALNVTYKVFPGVDMFVSVMSMVATGFVMLEASLKAQLLLLQIIDTIATPLLLPAGVILRFFPPTRDAGAFLLAVAIGFQVIFPLTYVINEQVITELGFEYERQTLLLTSLCGGDLFLGSLPVILIPNLVGVFSPALAGALGSALSGLFSQGMLQLFKVSEFMVILDMMSVISLMGFFAPSISMVFTVAFINALTKFIVMK